MAILYLLKLLLESQLVTVVVSVLKHRKHGKSNSMWVSNSNATSFWASILETLYSNNLFGEIRSTQQCGFRNYFQSNVCIIATLRGRSVNLNIPHK